MTIQEAFEKYKIMECLREHQLRVAAVAKQIIEASTTPLPKDNILTACLLHDMGNILKFDLTYFPEFLEPQGLEYWTAVKQEFEEKYGKSEHHATQEIAKEIGISAESFACLEAVGFSNITKNYKSGNLAHMICCYSDMRVGPFGILSIDERTEEGRKRYKARMKDLFDPENDIYPKTIDYLRKMEKHIFEHTTIRPEDITNESSKRHIEELRDFELR